MERNSAAVAVATWFAAALAGWALVFLSATGFASAASPKQVERGRSLAELVGCHYGHMLGKAAMPLRMGGAHVGFKAPKRGVIVGPNLTPDNETGLGNGSPRQIITAVRIGVRPDRCVRASVVPRASLARLPHADAAVTLAGLRRAPSIGNTQPGPFGPGETPAIPVLAMRASPATAPSAPLAN